MPHTHNVQSMRRQPFNQHIDRHVGRPAGQHFVSRFCKGRDGRHQRSGLACSWWAMNQGHFGTGQNVVGSLFLLHIEGWKGCRDGILCGGNGPRGSHPQPLVAPLDAFPILDVDPMAQGMCHGLVTAFIRSGIHGPTDMLDGHPLRAFSFQNQFHLKPPNAPHPRRPSPKILDRFIVSYWGQQHRASHTECPWNPSPFSTNDIPLGTSKSKGCIGHFHR